MKLGVAASLLTMLSATSCTVPYARVYAGYTKMGPSGDVALAPTSGTSNLGALGIDVESDLGLDEAGSPYARVDMGLGSFGLTVSAFTYHKVSSGTITKQFGNITAGTPVRSDLDLTDVKAAVIWNALDIPLPALGSVRVGPGFGVNFIDLNLDVQTTSGVAAADNVDVVAPIPMAFLQADVELGPFGMTVDGGGMSVDLNDAGGTYWDVEGLFRFSPAQHMHIFGGYRWISLNARGDADGQDFDANLALRGWFVGAAFSF